MTAFLLAFESQGYSQTTLNRYDETMTRLALYAKGDRVTHAARQLSISAWTSKLGQDKDISHTLAGLEGPTYGRVVAFYERPVER